MNSFELLPHEIEIVRQCAHPDKRTLHEIGGGVEVCALCCPCDIECLDKFYWNRFYGKGLNNFSEFWSDVEAT
jgi:hypothetical protein